MSSSYHLPYIYLLSIQVLWSLHLRSYLSNLGRNQEDPHYLVYLNLIGNTLNANRQLSGIKWDRWASPNYDNIFFALFFIYAWDFKNIAVLFPFFVTQHTHVPILQVPIEGQQNNIPKKCSLDDLWCLKRYFFEPSKIHRKTPVPKSLF